MALPMIKEQFLMSGEVARMLCVSHTSIVRMVEAGQLPVVGETSGGYRLFRRSDVERLMKSRASNPPLRGRPYKKPKEKATHQ